MTNPLIASLAKAVEAAPTDVALRLHLAELLLADGQLDAALGHCATALQQDPASGSARALMGRALGGIPQPQTGPPAEATPVESAPADGFDWKAAESEVKDIAPEPMFVEGDAGAEPEVGAWDVERATVRLADVGGMREVKERILVSFLAPMQNPEMRKLYGKSLRGGILLYGPPGCGKTFIGRAIAGEMGAQFINVGLSDVLDMYIGQSERNLHELFQIARRNAPVVIFLDEVDALGQKRSLTRHSAMRGTVNQLLAELDGVSDSNEGVYVVGATNQPWDVDPALRRPGRFDRTLLVLPPDQEAREAILGYHLKDRPIEGINLASLAKATDGYSGADLAHICESAAERAMMEGIRSGAVRMIRMDDLYAALREVRPSTGPWFDAARNVVQFANTDGTYDELRTYMKRTKKL
ncbi:MAG TPA: ATP-binding protein [Dermatophilaceae bacterium]|mgnify:FL=1|nr:ATP-binding protein [Dermatophilaceae bacterium]